MIRHDGWSLEMNATLLRLRNVEGMKWTSIGALLGKSKTACQAHYIKITKPDERVKLFRRTWSVEQETELHGLRFKDKLAISEISRLLDRSMQAISTKLERMRHGRTRIVHFEKNNIRFVIPQACIEDRNRRSMAAKSLTAILMGDPEPGRARL